MQSIAQQELVYRLTGLTRVMQNAMANTLLQITSADSLRGRVMSFYSLILHGTTQLGGLQAGFVADWIGAAVSLAYGAFVALRHRQVCNLA